MHCLIVKRKCVSPTSSDMKRDPVATAPGTDRTAGGCDLSILMIELINTKPSLCAKSVSLLFACLVFFWLCLLAPAIASAQTQTGEVQPKGELQVNGETQVNGEKIVFQRKRFYLIKGNLEESKALVARIDRQSSLIPTRECFYRNAKASEAFINWLKEVDCESVYCQSIEEKYLTGATAVPEFKKAYERSAKEYKSPELGRLWLATNLTDVIRDGFYRYKQDALKSLIGETQTDATTRDNSVMTDRTGQAFFTGLTPGTYLISNLIPIEFGGNSIVWVCEKQITTGPNALDIPSIDDSSTTKAPAADKCIVFKKPLPVCDTNNQTTPIR
jgi:hypothetical protein